MKKDFNSKEKTVNSPFRILNEEKDRNIVNIIAAKKAVEEVSRFLENKEISSIIEKVGLVNQLEIETEFGKVPIKYYYSGDCNRICIKVDNAQVSSIVLDITLNSKNMPEKLDLKNDKEKFFGGLLEAKGCTYLAKLIGKPDKNQFEHDVTKVKLQERDVQKEIKELEISAAVVRDFEKVKDQYKNVAELCNQKLSQLSSKDIMQSISQIKAKCNALYEKTQQSALSVEDAFKLKTEYNNMLDFMAILTQALSVRVQKNPEAALAIALGQNPLTLDIDNQKAIHQDLKIGDWKENIREKSSKLDESVDVLKLNVTRMSEDKYWKENNTQLQMISVWDGLGIIPQDIAEFREVRERFGVNDSYSKEYLHACDVLENPIALELIKKHLSGRKLDEAQKIQLYGLFASPKDVELANMFVKYEKGEVLSDQELAKYHSFYYFPEKAKLQEALTSVLNGNSNIKEDEKEAIIKRAAQIKLMNDDVIEFSRGTAIDNIRFELGRELPDYIYRTKLTVLYAIMDIVEMFGKSLNKEERQDLFKKLEQRWNTL